jgi:splicing factor 3A subunit 3
MVAAQRAAGEVAALLRDPNGRLRAEVDGMAAGGAGQGAAAEGEEASDPLALFYARLEEVRAGHRGAALAVESAERAARAGAAAAGEAALASFSAEELYGRYVDLAPLFEEFSNLPSVRDARFAAASGGRSAVTEPDVMDAALADYPAFLSKLLDLHLGLPHRVKASRSYRRYTPSLARYLFAFLNRRSPFLEPAEVLRGWAADFDRAWAAGVVAGWGGEVEVDVAPPALLPLSLSLFTSPEAVLEAWGPEGCKAQCALRGLKAGGSGEERAGRLWAVAGMDAKDYPKKLLALGGGGGGVGPAPSAPDPDPASTAFDPVTWGPARTPSCRAAWAEAVALNCARVLADVLSDTRRRVTRRATRTLAELAADRAAEEAEAEAEPGGGRGEEEEEGDSAPVYNPLNIPLGWDGKPIPYWLYRLHGLNVEFACEICGGALYRGRRDFDRHFQEWKHAAGMRALGIPNTKHFHDITKIRDAQERECTTPRHPSPTPADPRPPPQCLPASRRARTSRSGWPRVRAGRSTRTASGTC